MVLTLAAKKSLENSLSTGRRAVGVHTDHPDVGFPIPPEGQLSSLDDQSGPSH